MPYIIHGNTSPREVPADVTAAELDYAYPEGLDLKPGSELHEDLKNKDLPACYSESLANIQAL